MKFTIGEIIEKPVYKNVLKIRVQFMIGDADGYDHEDFYVPMDHPELDRFFRFLDNCDNAYPGGRGGNDDYDKESVEDWDAFCGDGPYVKDFSFCWPNEPNSCGIQCSYDRVIVSYFDENSVEHEVSFAKE